MVTSLDIAIELSDLFEQTGYEGTLVAEFFDKEVIPSLKTPLRETDMIGLGDKFTKAIERVRASLTNLGNDRIKTLKDMMKSALVTFVKNTHDAKTGREIFHRAIMSGADTMLTVTGATILANALAAQHPDQAQTLLQNVLGRLSGPQQRFAENSSGAAVSAGAIAAVPMGKKKKLIRRPDSIFAEDSLNWQDLQALPDTISVMEEVVNENTNRQYAGVLIDPTTAELVLAVHSSLNPAKQKQYECKPLREMIDIAYRAVQRGLIQVVME